MRPLHVANKILSKKETLLTLPLPKDRGRVASLGPKKAVQAQSIGQERPCRLFGARLRVCALSLLLFVFCVGCASTEERLSLGRQGDALVPAINKAANPYSWPDAPPADCTFEASTDIVGITFTGRYANYTGADTFYLAWASDGDCYSPWTDGYVWTDRKQEPLDCSYCNVAYKYKRKLLGLQKGSPLPEDRYLYHCHSNVAPTCTGQMRITGDSPLDLEFEVLGKMYSGMALYPCVSVIADDVFYIGTYSAFEDGGRFNGFRYSSDWGHWAEEVEPGWTNPYWTDTRSAKTDFFKTDRGPRRFNVPHAVVFGQNNSLSPDGKIYLTAHGQIEHGKSNWDKGDAVYLCRVNAAPEAVVNPEAHEFFAGHAADGNAQWSNNVQESQPILEWKNHLGSESITYIPPLKKFLLMTARLKEAEENLPYNVLVFWEADRVTGPYRMVHYLRDWGPQTYFPNIPAKFIGEDGKTLWLCVSSNYSQKATPNPFGCRYAASFHELTLNLAEKNK